MKKKCGYILVAVVVLLAAAFVWWDRETTFLSSVTAEEVSAVAVRDGHTGKAFEVTAEEEIAYMVREIKSASFPGMGCLCFGWVRGLRCRFWMNREMWQVSSW